MVEGNAMTWPTICELLVRNPCAASLQIEVRGER